jgi:subtilisin family serine protease
MTNSARQTFIKKCSILGYGLLGCLLIAGVVLSLRHASASGQQDRLQPISRDKSELAEKQTDSALTPASQGQSEFTNRSIAGRSNFDEMLKEARETGSARVIVGLRVGFEPEGVLSATAVTAQRRAIAQAQSSLLGRLSSNRIAAVKRYDFIPFIAFETDAAGLAQLRDMPEVTSIEEDAMQQLLLAESTALIGAQAAWTSGFSGTGQHVAILDTGVDKDHPFLANKVVSEACYSTTNTQTTSVCPGGAAQSTATDSGRNCDNSLRGCNHGTHVAGIAAGKSNTFSGVACDANIVAIQVFSKIRICPSSPSSCVVAYNSDILLGLQRVQTLSSMNIAAVNLSLGGGSSPANCDASEASRKTAVDSLRSVGVATVIASGNEANTNGTSSPACISTAISVGSTGDGSNGSTLNGVSEFSNSATFLNLLAPGEWIDSSVPGTGFANFAGTSMAAPHVAGAVAVLKSKTPNASDSQIVQTLSNTGLPITDPRNNIVKPRIRVDAASSALPATPCSYAISPGALAFNTDGSPGTVNVTSGTGCAWTATSNVPWITVASGASGTANGSVGITVASNTALPRTGTLFIGGNTFIVTQTGVPALAVDDGSFENAIGLTNGGTISAVNRLTPASYPAAINAVAIHFQNDRRVPKGTPITILYGVNPSGGTDVNNISFQTVPATFQSLDDFNVFPIPPIAISSGDFVVGYRLTHSSGRLPVTEDVTPPSARRSYISSGGAFTSEFKKMPNRILIELIPPIVTDQIHLTG